MMEKVSTPVSYLDAPEFAKYWERDAKRLAAAVEKIGKVEEVKAPSYRRVFRRCPPPGRASPSGAFLDEHARRAVLRQRARPPLERIAARNQPQVATGHEPEVADVVERRGDLPMHPCRCTPRSRGSTRRRSKGTEYPRSVLSLRRFVYRGSRTSRARAGRGTPDRASAGRCRWSSRSRPRGRGADRAPPRDRSRVPPACRGAGAAPRHPEGAGGEHRTFDAVRAARAQHLSHGEAGLAAELEILLQPVDERLDLARRVEAPQHGELGGREAKVLAAGEAVAQHGSQKI